MATRAINRRAMIAGGASLLAAPAVWAEPSSGVRRNASGFELLDWRDHFDTLEHGAIVADTRSRALHFWSADESVYRLFPTSVPRSPELTKLGLTRIVKKVDGPSWTPTPSMRERDPSLPATVPPGPENPMGTHALHLSWQYYRIHGTHDTRKIGRKSSDGCIGLYNEKIAELYELTEIGTQVRLI
ncbi:MAG: L,D-transpeptidase [Pseudomonadota bacterium]|uniref:L,D-transpeptidase n=1 Tax=Roseovarius TaxID=74030 RepID=UPI0022A8A83A|nr:L,D-transpeptidase [Roseovarius sp. EGI FJ00037]MCZ0813612.1 L,D-transpeptidase [Roseovarius sp. EGI FJ00037]